MSHKGRILTLIVECVDDDCSWIWEAHKCMKGKHGIRVFTISNGDLLKELEELNAQDGRG